MGEINILATCTLPPIDGMEDIIREHMPGYLFYTGRKYRRRGWCTACGEEMDLEPGMDALPFGNYPDYWRGSHNENVSCPQCGRVVKLKCMGRMHSCNTLDGHIRLMIPQKIHHDRVLLRCYYVEYTYRNPYERARLWWNEDARYDLQPGKAEMAWNSPYLDKWVSRAKPTEPWPLSRWWCASHVLDYYITRFTEFDGSFLEYFPFDRVGLWADWPVKNSYCGSRHTRTPWGKLLSLYCTYPNLEMAIKERMDELVKDFVCLDRKNHEIVDWKQTERAKFLRVNKAEAKEICKRSADVKSILYMRKRFGLSTEEAILWEDKGFHCGRAPIEEEEKQKELQFNRYLIKQGYGWNGRGVYYDYLKWCRELGRDTNVPSIQWPKNLNEAHDRMYQAHLAIEEEKRRQREAEKQKILAGYPVIREWYRKIFAFADEQYIIRIPETLQEIVEEGKAQHHCVAGYVDRHAEKKTVIVFMRKADDPDTPLYTIEVSPDGILKQAQGYHNDYNKRPVGPAKEFIDNWLIEVKKRIRKEEKETKRKQEEAAS